MNLYKRTADLAALIIIAGMFGYLTFLLIVGLPL